MKIQYLITTNKMSQAFKFYLKNQEKHENGNPGSLVNELLTPKGKSNTKS